MNRTQSSKCSLLILCGLSSIMLSAALPAGENVLIPGGVFWMGTDNEMMRDAHPWHQVRVHDFLIDKTPVTNKAFAAFVKATAYVTVAERKPNPKDFPGAPAKNLVAGSVIFTPPDHTVPLNNHFQWWSYKKGADWRHPAGPKTRITKLDHHPVVHVAWEDAAAYCKWSGKRLPTEAEFEHAARGGLEKKPYPWGQDLRPGGRHMANIWQGPFPNQNTRDDGFTGTSPVGSFPANGYGLYDMAGNVWEWVSDWYQADYYAKLAAQEGPADNPKGPAESLDPAEPRVPKRVMRGGSYLCTDQYCSRYEVGSRGKGAVDTGTNHLGFRCAVDATQR